MTFRIGSVSGLKFSIVSVLFFRRLNFVTFADWATGIPRSVILIKPMHNNSDYVISRLVLHPSEFFSTTPFLRLQKETNPADSLFRMEPNFYPLVWNRPWNMKKPMWINNWSDALTATGSHIRSAFTVCNFITGHLNRI